MRRAAPWLVAGLGVVLAGAGVAVFWTTNLAPADVGWFSYAPLEAGSAPPEAASRWAAVWTRGHVVGAALLVLGLLVLATLAGWLAGRRSVADR